MSKWSEELQETTRMEVFPGAIMKDEDHNYGIFFEINGNVVIKGIVPGSGLMPKASDEILATLQAAEPYFVRKVIPAGTYDGQDEDINTITCKAALYCRADMDEETVYQITKAFYESGDVIAAAHATGKEVQLEGCLEGITTPIHPGAARYFTEMGIEVPNNG